MSFFFAKLRVLNMSEGFFVLEDLDVAFLGRFFFKLSELGL